MNGRVQSCRYGNETLTHLIDAGRIASETKSRAVILSAAKNLAPRVGGYAIAEGKGILKNEILRYAQNDTGEWVR